MDYNEYKEMQQENKKLTHDLWNKIIIISASIVAFSATIVGVLGIENFNLWLLIPSWVLYLILIILGKTILGFFLRTERLIIQDRLYISEAKNNLKIFQDGYNTIYIKKQDGSTEEIDDKLLKDQISFNKEKIKILQPREEKYTRRANKIFRIGELFFLYLFIIATVLLIISVILMAIK